MLILQLVVFKSFYFKVHFFKIFQSVNFLGFNFIHMWWPSWPPRAAAECVACWRLLFKLICNESRDWNNWFKSSQVHVFTVFPGTAVYHYGSIKPLTFIPRCRLMGGLPWKLITVMMWEQTVTLHTVLLLILVSFSAVTSWCQKHGRTSESALQLLVSLLESTQSSVRMRLHYAASPMGNASIKSHAHVASW